MDKQIWKVFFNPFIRIAGWQALAIGFTGLVVSTIISYLTDYHYHGLLHFGPATNNALWCFAAEHLLIWLIPSVIFYVGGVILSKSKIRIIDVLGTISFAQLPLILMNLFFLLPPLRKMIMMDLTMSPLEMIEQPGFWLGAWLSAVGGIFLIWSLVWMFNALKVSTNLKGYPLGILYCIGVFGGDSVCRLIIGLFY